MDLAYLFWHWPQPRIDESLYVERLAAFHSRLAQTIPDILYGSRIVRMDPPPGIPLSRPVYLDWYVVQNWTDLGRLNAGAVSAVNAEAHDAVAPLAADGIAAVYGARIGIADSLPSALHSYWFAKPKGMTYPQLDALLAPYLELNRSTLWQRQMVLGPTPEFCLTTPAAVVLPDSISFQERKMTAIQP